jgi:type I restriction enzyme S subunit
MSEWKQTEIGIIPFDWKIQSSSIYCKKITDGTHDSPKSATSGYPLITSKHIKDSLIDFKEAYLVSEEDYQAIIKRSKVEQYDLIISMIGEYCGFTYLEMNQEVNYAIKNVGLFKNKSLTAAKWLKYYLDSPIGKHQLRLRRSGTSQPYISLGALRELPIITPSSEDERKKIVDILSCLDNKIDNLRRQNETLEKIAQTLFKHWFIDFEFPNNDGKPYKSSGGAMVASELGDIPAGWRVGKLEELIIVNPRESIKTGAIVKYVDMRALSTSSMEITDYVTREFTSGSKFKNQDTLLARITPCLENGKTAFVSILDDGEVAFGSTEFIVLRAKENCCPEYIYPLARSPYFRDFAVKNMTGSSGRQRIPNDVIANYKLAIPDIETIKNYQKICRPLFLKTSSNQKQIQILTKTRDSLLPKLMSGQIRIKERESIIEEVK